MIETIKSEFKKVYSFTAKIDLPVDNETKQISLTCLENFEYLKMFDERLIVHISN